MSETDQPPTESRDVPFVEFYGEYPPLAVPARRDEARARGFVSGNYVAEPGPYTCVGCAGAIAPATVQLKAGQRLPMCPHCGPRGTWRKR